MRLNFILIIIFALIIVGCAPKEHTIIDRESLIPADKTKVSVEQDLSPVKSESAEYFDPEPMPYPITTAGAEDSAFVLPDGNTLYLFFTPDVRVPIQNQVADGVTGIYVSYKQGSEWSKPERIFLQNPGKLAGDGCEFVLGNMMMFCTVREGYAGIHWFKAELKDGKWKDWKIADFEPSYKVGELHMTNDGNAVYYHSDRPGGKGGLDIWKITKTKDGWSLPENVEAVNTERNDGWPALNPQEDELWISRDYAVWRSKLVDGEWQETEKMFSPLAGEATIDSDGNVYFTHHFFRNDTMIEADIYLAKKK